MILSRRSTPQRKAPDESDRSGWDDMLKTLSNVGEMRVYRQIEPITVRCGASVYLKVRIADVVDIDKLTLGSMRF